MEALCRPAPRGRSREWSCSWHVTSMGVRPTCRGRSSGVRRRCLRRGWVCSVVFVPPVPIVTTMSTMSTVAAMAKHVHQRTGREQQKWEPIQAGHEMGTVLGQQIERCNSEKQPEAHPQRPGSDRRGPVLMEDARRTCFRQFTFCAHVRVSRPGKRQHTCTSFSSGMTAPTALGQPQEKVRPRQKLNSR